MPRVTTHAEAQDSQGHATSILQRHKTMPYTVPKGATTHASIPKCRAPKTGQGRCTTYTEAQDSPRACVPRAHSAHMQSIQDRPRMMHTSQRPKTVQGQGKPLRTPRTLQSTQDRPRVMQTSQRPKTVQGHAKQILKHRAPTKDQGDAQQNFRPQQ